MTTIDYSGSCHCGAVRFSFSHDQITEGVRCNCSICVRRGATMSTFLIPPAEFRIEASNQSLASYQFGSHIAKHYFCRHCGIYPFHQSMIKVDHYRVNLGCIDDIDTTKLPQRMYDGQSI